MGINRLVDIGKSALFTAQQAISVAGHNIANVNTPGFSRQQVTLAENRPENGSPGQIGTGVHAESIRRSFDSFVEQQLLASRERLGEFTASSNALARLEPMFGDANNLGIGAGLNEFFRALQDVATNPNDLSARTVLLSKVYGARESIQSVRRRFDCGAGVSRSPSRANCYGCQPSHVSDRGFECQNCQC